MTVDAAIEKADLRKIGKLQGSFAPASFTGRLSERRSGADGKQRGNGREFHAHAACNERSSGEPGAHNESSEIKRFVRNFKRV